MDPFAQLIQRKESSEKVRELVQALRLLPVADGQINEQFNTALEHVLAPPTDRIPEVQRKISEFTFTEPEISYQDVTVMEKYRPMKHGIHFLDDDNT